MNFRSGIHTLAKTGMVVEQSITGVMYEDTKGSGKG
jgi:hypothetical protein